MVELEAMSTAPGGVLAARGGAAEAPASAMLRRVRVVTVCAVVARWRPR